MVFGLFVCLLCYWIVSSIKQKFRVLGQMCVSHFSRGPVNISVLLTCEFGGRPLAHWTAKLSSVASGFSWAARQELLLGLRQDLRFSAVQTYNTKCFLFLCSPFLLFSLCYLYNERLDGAEVSFHDCIRTKTSEEELVEGKAMPLGITWKYTARRENRKIFASSNFCRKRSYLTQDF